MKIPHQQIDADTLQNLIEEYVTRDGTDYGEQETSLADRVVQVKRLLESGDAEIRFDEELQLAEIVSCQDR